MEKESTTSVFDLEALAKVYPVGDQVLKLMPLTNKQLRLFTRAIQNAITDVAGVGPEQQSLGAITDVILDKVPPILKIVFPNAAFITPEFVDENMSLALLRVMLEDVVRINRLQDLYPFFERLLSKTSEVAPRPPATPGA